MTTETNLQQTVRQSREAYERLRADIAKNPQFAAMSQAAQRTADELSAIEAANAKLREADEAVTAAGLALLRARRGMATVEVYDTKRPFGFFQRKPDTYKAALAAVPALREDLNEARMQRQNALRRLNAKVAEVDAARAERRRLAKLAHGPKLKPVSLRPDQWSSMAGLKEWNGAEGAE